MHHRSFQKAFFRQLADPSAIRTIFDHLPDAYFFVKDREGRLIAASSAILARLGLKTEADFVGRSDYDVFPRHLADAYAADDTRVFHTGKPLVNRLELWLDENGQPDWCVTTKVPLFAGNGQVAGLMGLTRREANPAAARPAAEVTRAVQYVRQNASVVLTTAELARAVGTSERTLHRRIRQAFGVPPYELMLRLRVQMAAEALIQSPASIAAIAQAHGFCDQSGFTQHFRKRMGATPLEFIRRHRSGTAAEH